jgi:hypothetical protein
MVVRRVGPLSFAKISGLIYAIFRLVAGAFFALVSPLAGTTSQLPAGFGPLFGVAAIIIFPLLYGVIGFVVSLIGAWIYNGIAGIVGGVNIEVEPAFPAGGNVTSNVGD